MSVATTSVYLFHGFDQQRRDTEHQPWPDMDLCNGFTGLVEYITDMAALLETVWQAEQADVECPGVYDYDITEPMGAWLYMNFEKASAPDFINELRRRFSDWITRG